MAKKTQVPLRFEEAEWPYEPTNKKSRRSGKKSHVDGCLAQYEESNVTKQNRPANVALQQAARLSRLIYKCDGYSQLALAKSATRESHACEESNTFVLQALSTNSNTFQDGYERRSFDHFLNRTALQLGGCFDLDFWGRWLPQAVYQEPAIKHAVIALSALHERFQSSDPVIYKSVWSHSDGLFALRQYNQAIRLLTNPGKGRHPPVDVCLIACILFACFEAIRGHHGSAISHIGSGVNIFAEMNGREQGIQSSQQGSKTLSSEGYVSMAHLQVLFNRLDFQKLQMVGSQPMELAAHHGQGAPGFCASIPTAFSSIEEARNSLAYHASRCTAILDSDDRYAERAQYLPVLQHWGSAVDAFETQNPLSARNIQAIRLLQVGQKFIEMSFAVQPTSITHHETDWDLHLDDCKEILSLATEALQTSPDALDGVKECPSFCFDGVLVGPLFALGHKCRDPFVRREAARLLKKYPRQEGIWDSVLAGRVVEKLISLEEQGLGAVEKCQDVPDCARLNEVNVTFDIEGRLGTIWYKRRVGSLLTGTLIREFKDHIKW